MGAQGPRDPVTCWSPLDFVYTETCERCCCVHIRICFLLQVGGICPVAIVKRSRVRNSPSHLVAESDPLETAGKDPGERSLGTPKNTLGVFRSSNDSSQSSPSEASVCCCDIIIILNPEPAYLGVKPIELNGILLLSKPRGACALMRRIGPASPSRVRERMLSTRFSPHQPRLILLGLQDFTNCCGNKLFA